MTILAFIKILWLGGEYIELQLLLIYSLLFKLLITDLTIEQFNRFVS